MAIRDEHIRKRVESEFNELYRECKSFSTKKELGLLRTAFRLTNEKSELLPDRWGKPEISHAISIGKIIASEMGLATTSIIASLLGPFAQKEISLAYIEEHFGKKVAEIAGGLTKLSEIQITKTSSQAENLRNLILTMARDVRVILINLAERLYLMRNLQNEDEARQIEIASETRFIYSPLAHRMGLYTMMSEMEDISMKFLESEPYRMIDSRLRATRGKREKFIADFIAPLDERLDKMGLKAEIKGRPKAISSIWRKMKKQKVDFDEVYDKFAIRIILKTPPKNEKSDCWRAYSVVTDIYRPNPDRLRDWISVPKSNGYESLHTTVVVPGGEWVEVQIRSERMNEIAEKGLAAHWKYKGIKGEKGLDDWLAKIRDLLENPEVDAFTLIDDLKLRLENKEIFVFTPDGDLKKFPQGATVLDFAFDIHSAVGNSCIGARVNGRNVPIRYHLQNGDKVEIQRSKNQKANMDWLNYVVTNKAKSKIKQALKEDKLKEAENGKEILRRRFKNWKLDYNDASIRQLVQDYKYGDALELYYDIATGKLDVLEIKEKLTEDEPEEIIDKSHQITENELDNILQKTIRDAEDFLVIDDRLAGVDYRFAKCCNPIFGDEVFGFVTISSGITIHRLSCPNAQQLISSYGYRVVKARWANSDNEKNFMAKIQISGLDDIGIISNISDVISRDLKVNMRSFKMDSGHGTFEGTITLFVRDNIHLNVLIRKLSKVKGVNQVKRIK